MSRIFWCALWGSLSGAVSGPTCVLLSGHGARRSQLENLCRSLAFLPRHENVIEERGGSDSGFLLAVRADQVIFSVSHSAPNAKEPSRHLGTAVRPPGLAIRRAQGSISRAPGRRHHGRQVRSAGIVDAGGLQSRGGSAVHRTSRVRNRITFAFFLPTSQRSLGWVLR